MNPRNLQDWMWGEALSMLEQADRLHRQFFRIGSRESAQMWEPPIDLIETADAVRLTVVLPGVPADSVLVSLEPGGITVTAVRPFPADRQAARIHRLEIPYGRFARSIPLPSQLPEGSLELVEQRFVDGCLTLTFAKRPSVA
jgi:HSP20 family molecular chaperone IbpA